MKAVDAKVEAEVIVKNWIDQLTKIYKDTKIEQAIFYGSIPDSYYNQAEKLYYNMVSGLKSKYYTQIIEIRDNTNPVELYKNALKELCKSALARK